MSLCKHTEEVCCNMTLHGGKVYCDAGFCVLHDDPPPKTNADHIRSMTDEELAELLLDGVAEKVCPNGCDGCDSDCEGHFLNWLRQPYKEAADD